MMALWKKTFMLEDLEWRLLFPCGHCEKNTRGVTIRLDCKEFRGSDDDSDSGDSDF
jgi:hypothetical protein